MERGDIDRTVSLLGGNVSLFILESYNGYATLISHY